MTAPNVFALIGGSDEVFAVFKRNAAAKRTSRIAMEQGFEWQRKFRQVLQIVPSMEFVRDFGLVVAELRSCLIPRSQTFGNIMQIPKQIPRR